MAKRSRKLPRDTNQLAKAIVDQATGQAPPDQSADAQKDPAAVKRGRAGGLKGGPVRAKRLAPNERSAIARKAARARWQAKSPESKIVE